MSRFGGTIRLSSAGQDPDLSPLRRKGGGLTLLRLPPRSPCIAPGRSSLTLLLRDRNTLRGASRTSGKPPANHQHANEAEAHQVEEGGVVLHGPVLDENPPAGAPAGVPRPAPSGSHRNVPRGSHPRGAACGGEELRYGAPDIMEAPSAWKQAESTSGVLRRPTGAAHVTRAYRRPGRHRADSERRNQGQPVNPSSESYPAPYTPSRVLPRLSTRPNCTLVPVTPERPPPALPEDTLSGPRRRGPAPSLGKPCGPRASLSHWLPSRAPPRPR